MLPNNKFWRLRFISNQVEFKRGQPLPILTPYRNNVRSVVQTVVRVVANTMLHVLSRLGDAYREGVGTNQNWEQAFRWYTLAARAGDAEAQNNLGTLYLEGFYCPEDFEQATYWYRKSAKQGACVAQYNLGMRFIRGQGVPMDFQQAMQWLEKSADQGYALAYCDLGIMHLHGEGCSPDRERAKELLIKAALADDERAFRTLDNMIPELEEAVLQGDMDLMFQLPWLYYKGLGGVDCKAKAWAWMLWLDVQGPLPGGLGCSVIEDVTEMSHQFSFSDSANSDKRQGEELFNAMKLEHAIPRYPTLEEMVAEDVEDDPPRDWREMQLDKWRHACSSEVPIEILRSKKKRGQHVILDVCAEGGGFTLFGAKKSGQWVFWCELNDWTPTLEDEPAIHRRSDNAASWNEAISLMNEHCRYWMDLSPQWVHPDFRKRIWEIVERRHIVSNLIGLDEGSL